MKGVSALIVAIFLVMVSVSLTYGFLAWSRATQEGLQEGIEGEAERSAGAAGAGLAIVAVADNKISVKNTGKNVIDMAAVNVLLDGSVAESVSDVDALGPNGAAVINVTNFVPGIKTIKVTGPLGASDETREPILYPGAVGFWDFDRADESNVKDSSSGGTDGELNGTTMLALHFDESRGNVVTDASAHKNDGAVENGVQWTSGVSRSALQFDGTNDHVVVKDSASLDITGDITVELWAKLDTAKSETLIEKGGCNGYAIWADATRAVEFVKQCDAGSRTGRVQVSLGGWHHIVGVKKGGVGTLYIDGAQVAQDETFADFGNVGDMTIGKGLDGAFDGSMDEVAVHARELSPAEIRERYEAKRALFSEYVDGVHNDAVLLNKTSVRIPDSQPLDVFSTASFETWINIRGGSTAQDAILWKDGAYALWFDSTTNVLTGRIWRQGGSAVDVTSSVITRNAWHHVVVTADGALLKVYLDGALSAQSSYTGQIPFAETPLVIGDSGIDAVVDYVAVYKNALSAEEIASIYSAGSE